jgi:hypothetical protein
MFRLFVASALMCSLSTIATAITPELAGLRQVHLVIEDLSKDANSCGITKDLIRDAFMHPAGAAKFQLDADLNSAAFHIHVNTVRLANAPVCVSDVRATVYSLRPATLGFSSNAVRATVLLWYDAILATATSGQHSSQVKGDIETLTKRFIAEWDLSNK